MCTNYSIKQIKDAVGNEYGKPKDVVGEQRMAFTSHADSSFDVCFENHFTGSEFILIYLWLNVNTDPLSQELEFPTHLDTSNSTSISEQTQKIGPPSKPPRN